MIMNGMEAITQVFIKKMNNNRKDTERSHAMRCVQALDLMKIREKKVVDSCCSNIVASLGLEINNRESSKENSVNSQIDFKDRNCLSAFGRVGENRGKRFLSDNFLHNDGPEKKRNHQEHSRACRNLAISDEQVKGFDFLLDDIIPLQNLKLSDEEKSENEVYKDQKLSNMFPSSEPLNTSPQQLGSNATLNVSLVDSYTASSGRRRTPGFRRRHHKVMTSSRKQKNYTDSHHSPEQLNTPSSTLYCSWLSSTPSRKSSSSNSKILDVGFCVSPIQEKDVVTHLSEVQSSVLIEEESDESILLEAKTLSVMFKQNANDEDSCENDLEDSFNSCCSDMPSEICSDSDEKCKVQDIAGMYLSCAKSIESELEESTEDMHVKKRILLNPMKHTSATHTSSVLTEDLDDENDLQQNWKSVMQTSISDCSVKLSPVKPLLPMEDMVQDTFKSGRSPWMYECIDNDNDDE